MLVHAGSVRAEAFDALVERLVPGGPPLVVRAFADWTRPEVEGWLSVLRRHGVTMRHHFRTRDSHDPAVVALTVEALALAEGGSFDQFLLVGDLGAATPLVERLHELRISVTAVGPSRTPHDFRSTCDEFWLLSHFDGAHPAGGRHRAN